MTNFEEFYYFRLFYDSVFPPTKNTKINNVIILFFKNSKKKNRHLEPTSTYYLSMTSYLHQTHIPNLQLLLSIREHTKQYFIRKKTDMKYFHCRMSFISCCQTLEKSYT